MPAVAKRPSLTVLAIAAGCAVVLASFAWYSVTRSVELRISVRLPVDDVDGVRAATQLVVTVRNAGDGAARPSFWVMWSLYPRMWPIESGPPTLPPGATAEYTIRSPLVSAAVPDGELFIVKVFDQVSGIYFRSEPVRLNLTESPPIANSELRYWSKVAPSGGFQPFGWSVGSRIEPGDSIYVGPSNGTRGARIVLHEDGGGSVPSYQSITQTVRAEDVPVLTTTSLALCWQQAFDFVAEPGSGFPMAGAGIELASEDRLAWLVLSSSQNVTVDLPTERIFSVMAQTSGPGCAVLPLADMIDYLGGTSLETLRFSFLAAVWPRPSLAGDHVFDITRLAVFW